MINMLCLNGKGHVSYVIWSKVDTRLIFVAAWTVLADTLWHRVRFVPLITLSVRTLSVVLCCS